MATMTAAERLAEQRAIALSADLQLQLEKGAGTRPVVAMLAKAREAAFIAMNTLIYADPADTEKVRGLQHEIRRYDDLVAWCQEIFVEGLEADVRLTEEDQREFGELIMSPEIAAEAAAIGVHKQGFDA
jgi:hypothetical protein